MFGCFNIFIKMTVFRLNSMQMHVVAVDLCLLRVFKSYFTAFVTSPPGSVYQECQPTYSWPSFPLCWPTNWAELNSGPAGNWDFQHGSCWCHPLQTEARGPTLPNTEARESTNVSTSDCEEFFFLSKVWPAQLKPSCSDMMLILISVLSIAFTVAENRTKKKATLVKEKFRTIVESIQMFVYIYKKKYGIYKNVLLTISKTNVTY